MLLMVRKRRRIVIIANLRYQRFPLKQLLIRKESKRRIANRKATKNNKILLSLLQQKIAFLVQILIVFLQVKVKKEFWFPQPMLQLLRSTRRMIYLMGKFLAIFRTRKIPIIKSIKKAQELPKNRKLRNPKNNIIKKNLKISRLKRIIITILLKIISWSAKRHYLKRWDGKKTNASKQLTKSMRKKYKNIV